MRGSIELAAATMHDAKRVVVLTGAGVSKESELPTFREPGTGIWAKYDPYVVASAAGFAQDPDASWRWHEHLRNLAQQAEPNLGHRALADLEALFPHVVVITQNIDDMHERAGSQDVIPIHGTLSRNRCFFDCLGAPTYIAWEDLEGYQPDGGVPRCPHCGRWARPDVVWFGEMLPESLIDRAFTEAQLADVLLVVGTSGTVQPAASLPVVAQRMGVRIIDVNPVESEISAQADVWLEGASGEVLPQLVDVLRMLRNERPVDET